MDQENSQPPPEPRRGHETSDASPRGLAIFMAALVVCLAVVLLIVWGVFVSFRNSQAADNLAAGSWRSPLADQRQPPPEPRLQPSPAHPTLPYQDAQTLRQEAEQVLGSYGWVDRADGRVRIPIDRAQALFVERGLPATLPAVDPGPVPTTVPAAEPRGAPTTPVEGGP